MTSGDMWSKPGSTPPPSGDATAAGGPGFSGPGFGEPAGFGAPGGVPPMIRPDLPPTAPAAYGLTYWPPGTPGWPPLASPWKRLGQALLDVVLAVVTLGIGWFIWQFFTWGDGQTPAMKLLRLRVVATTTGRPATWGHMILREWVVKGLTIGLITAVTFYIGFLVAALMIFSTYRQTLWDKIISTVVVDEAKMA